MTFARAIKPPNKLQQERQDAARALGCVICIRQRQAIPCGPVEIHHQTQSGRTISQDHTIALGLWHHRGEVSNYHAQEGFTRRMMLDAYGYSVAHGSKAFAAVHGTNDELLHLQCNLVGYPMPEDTQESRRAAKKRKGNTASSSKTIRREEAR